jgi:hypothetical protein
METLATIRTNVLCRTNMPLISRNHVSSIQSTSICNFPKRVCSEHPQAKPTELYTSLQSLPNERVVGSASCALKIYFLHVLHSIGLATKPFPNVIIPWRVCYLACYYVISILDSLNVLLHTCSNKEKRTAQFKLFLNSKEWCAPTGTSCSLHYQSATETSTGLMD